MTVILDQLETAAHSLDAAKDNVVKDITALNEVHFFFLIHLSRINLMSFKAESFKAEPNHQACRRQFRVQGAMHARVHLFLLRKFTKKRRS